MDQAINPKVKAFAEMMVKDHSAAEKKLQAAAKSAGTVKMMLDPDHQAMVDALKTKTGPDFYKAYIADQVQAHKDAADLLKDYKTDGSDKSLKAWATKTLPAVNMHLKKAEAPG